MAWLRYPQHNVIGLRRSPHKNKNFLQFFIEVRRANVLVEVIGYITIFPKAEQQEIAIDSYRLAMFLNKGAILRPSVSARFAAMGLAGKVARFPAGSFSQGVAFEEGSPYVIFKGPLQPCNII